jgi:hypothetical protein
MHAPLVCGVCFPRVIMCVHMLSRVFVYAFMGVHLSLSTHVLCFDGGFAGMEEMEGKCLPSPGMS